MDFDYQRLRTNDINPAGILILKKSEGKSKKREKRIDLLFPFTISPCVIAADESTGHDMTNGSVVQSPLTTQSSRVETDVVCDKGGDEVEIVVIAFLKAQI